MLLQQVQSMQHRSKGAYQDGRTVPTHDPCMHRYRSGSGRLQVGKDHRCKPIHQGMRFPNGVEVKSDCVGRGNNCTRDDVVTVHERTSNGFTNTIDVHRGSSDEGDDETDGCCEQRRDHQDAKPTDIQTVVGAGNPFAERVPGRLSLLLDESRLSIVIKLKVRPSGKWWSYYFLPPLRQDMRDCSLDTLFSLGKACVTTS